MGYLAGKKTPEKNDFFITIHVCQGERTVTRVNVGPECPDFPTKVPVTPTTTPTTPTTTTPTTTTTKLPPSMLYNCGPTTTITYPYVENAKCQRPVEASSYPTQPTNQQGMLMFNNVAASNLPKVSFIITAGYPDLTGTGKAWGIERDRYTCV
ncbi:hypothetical protein BV898_08198 [Hypsibius exemplaris]|uniref:Uncharacterized protein n=1 Tax=Hypsibius exemplaris TaxID=2072580 RepID=A0A1W0WRA8_HYPEX|nr:hypothetical protein BV898_08198 [Hypsibius exemplaris]